MFKTLKLGFLLFALSTVIISCSSSVEGIDPSIEPAGLLKRLIFTGVSNVGDLKVEFNEAYIESVLYGNPDWLGTPFATSPSYTQEYPTKIMLAISNLEYDGEIVSSVLCDYDKDNRIGLIYTSSQGDLSRGPDGKFYRHIFSIIPPVDFYVDQDLDEAVLNARVNSFYLMQNCTGSDGKVYEVSFYPDTDVLAHGLTTTFTVEDSSISGIVRVHQEGNGHVPFVDMLFY
jgi:hypothetical protein